MSNEKAIDSTTISKESPIGSTDDIHLSAARDGVSAIYEAKSRLSKCIAILFGPTNVYLVTVNHHLQHECVSLHHILDLSVNRN